VLLPLNRSAGLGGEIVQYAVYALDFGKNAVGNPMKQGVWDFLDCCRCRIHRVDRADNDGPVPTALAVPDTGRAEVRNDRKILPDFFVKPCIGKLLPQDGIGFAQSFQPVARNGAGATNTKTGTREWLTVDHVVRETQCLADYAYLVLIQELDRLSYDMDPYEYNDTVSDQEEQVQRITDDIRNGKIEHLQDFLQKNMAEVFQEAMLLECVNFTWLAKIEKMKLSNRKLDN